MSCLEKLLLMVVGPWLKRNNFSDEDIARSCGSVLNLKERIFLLFWEKMRNPILQYQNMKRNLVLSIPDRDARLFLSEIAFLKMVPEISVFPYPYSGENALENVDVSFAHGLPFVGHQGRPLYFSKEMSTDRVSFVYRYLMETEGITGKGKMLKSPHSYVKAGFAVEEGDILLDVGCSEGLFALDNLDRASKVYLFETQKCWEKANLATFSLYGDKVKVYNRFVGAKTDKHEIRLEDAVASESVEATYFIKMDIEGGERAVIADSERFLKQHRVKLACAAYHRQDDAEFLAGKLKALGFEVEFSDGYMLPDINGFVYPYFRKGMIYARNY